MPEINFDIIDYISGLTGFVFDKTVLERIALDRGVDDVEDYEELDQRTKDLLRADLLYTAYCSPNVMANHSIQHGAFSKSVGAQTVSKDDLYQIFMGIYRKYDDEMLDVIDNAGNVNWIDF